MTRPHQPTGRKRRTREHIIADLGVNFVERVILECGYAAERKIKDYGTDLIIDTFDSQGEIEAGRIDIQVKATETVARAADGQSVPYRVAVADLKAWLFEIGLVILVLYDTRDGVAYWLDVQDYARAVALDLGAKRTTTLRIPVTNVWTPDTVRNLREEKNQLADRIRRLRYVD